MAINLSVQEIIKKLDKSSKFIFINMSSIKTFEQNIYFIVSKYNIKLKSIVLHGDVVNRKIGIANKYLYNNDLKSKYKLIEMYDIEKNIEFSTCNCMYPKIFKTDPLKWFYC